jgi:penicillin-binding protein 2
MKNLRENWRLIALGTAIWLLFGAFMLRLVDLQIVNGPAFLAAQQRGSSITQTIKAARGDILDRNGNPLAYNEVHYNIGFMRSLSPAGSENETILKLINILRKSGETWLDSLPVSKTAPYAFIGSESDVARLKDKNFLNLNSYASADEVVYWLRVRYGLEDYSEEDVRAVAGVRYEMEKKNYSLNTNFIFAPNVSLETAVYIRQINADLPGVYVEEAGVRSYVDGSLAPHIVGRIGAIFPDELQEYLASDRGYTREDLVGKEGIERAFESTLRGIDGVRRIVFDSGYNVIGLEEEKPPVAGNSVTLTIDKDLQRTAADALAAEIKLLNETAPEGQGKEADAGAVAVVDVKTGEVLAAVTYPSYDLSTYSADYAKNSANPLHPFLNRAFSGVYAPGSCFKPSVSVGALAEGLITPQTKVNCQQVYTFFPGYQPTCLSYHGWVTVTDALRVSCNIFFYDTGRRLGIEKMNAYANALGLGVPTGIELSEAAGHQTDPATANPGDALQTAIGQLDNGYTPLQLANYAATIARRGERMKLSLVKSISSYYDTNDIIYRHELTVADRLDVPQAVFETVIEGMKQASRPGGTSAMVFGNYPIDVASKTGTPQTKEFPNSTYIAFAPADDPQIAVAVVIEKGWHGYTGAPVAKAVFDRYFFPPDETAVPDEASNEIPPAGEVQSAIAVPENPPETLPEEGQPFLHAGEQPDETPAQPSAPPETAESGGESSSSADSEENNPFPDRAEGTYYRHE